MNRDNNSVHEIADSMRHERARELKEAGYAELSADECVAAALNTPGETAYRLTDIGPLHGGISTMPRGTVDAPKTTTFRELLEMGGQGVYIGVIDSQQFGFGARNADGEGVILHVNLAYDTSEKLVDN